MADVCRNRLGSPIEQIPLIDLLSAILAAILFILIAVKMLLASSVVALLVLLAIQTAWYVITGPKN